MLNKVLTVVDEGPGTGLSLREDHASTNKNWWQAFFYETGNHSPLMAW